MIKVGINENVILSKVSVTDKGWLNMVFESLGGPEETSVDVNDPFAVASAGEAIETSKGTQMNILPILPAKEEGKDSSGAAIVRTMEQRAGITVQDITELLNKLKHIMGCYTTTDVIASTFADIYAGSGFTPQIMKERGPVAYHELLIDKDRMGVVSLNIFNAFVSAMAPFANNPELPMRLKLVRQSAEKHYATLPSARFVKTNPFMEPMSVPAAASKVAFTAYEKQKGLDSSAVVTQASADPVPGMATAAAVDASNPFGTRA